MENWKAELEVLLKSEDHAALLRVSRSAPARSLRYLNARLFSDDPETKWRAVRAVGALAADPGMLSDEKLTEQLRRYIWSLNDESGAVPFGIPEAIGEILARRPSLRETFLPLICAMTDEADVSQTGAVERGVIWAVGRIGAPVTRCDPGMAPRLVTMASSHPDAETRRLAAWALEQLRNGVEAPAG